MSGDASIAEQLDHALRTLLCAVEPDSKLPKWQSDLYLRMVAIPRARAAVAAYKTGTATPGKTDCPHGRAVGFCPLGCNVPAVEHGFELLHEGKPERLDTLADLKRLMRYHGVKNWEWRRIGPGHDELTVPAAKVDAVRADVDDLRCVGHSVEVLGSVTNHE